MTGFDQRFAPFRSKMRAEGIPDAAIRTFELYFRRLVDGETGLIHERSIEPVDALIDATTFTSELQQVGLDALDRTVLIKLNGGLGTGMGLDGPKSLLVVKGRHSFLDVVVRQAARQGVLLLLMNSHSTDSETAATLREYPAEIASRVWSFMQHRVPKIVRDDLTPASWPADSALEWCPPGHGDLYPALVTSGMLDRLLAAGYRFAFVSNVDNLGAVIDPALLGYFASRALPFMMEVADRTAADRKGGHLARRRDGTLILRELAQCPPDEHDRFQDVERYRYFNTNNLWLDLRAVSRLMTECDDVLGLPMIRNAKSIDPRRSGSTPVYQLETAMGSAIERFPGAAALRVPRLRFAPVKTTNDLLVIRSDVYVLTDDFRIVPEPSRPAGELVVDLDPEYFAFVDRMDARFPCGAPSLRECERLEVRGDVRFGRGVKLRGEVRIVNDSTETLRIEDGAELGSACDQSDARTD